MISASGLQKITKCLRRAFLGYKVFSGENRSFFISETLNDSRIRTNFALYFILLIQIINLILNVDPQKHAKFLNLIMCGILSFTLVCLVYAILFYFFRRRKTSLAARNFLVKSFWALILLFSLFFTYSNFAEEGNAAP